ncbi:DMT family transporter [Oceaniglobus ichthyenteri]|uniref:DMT family transporter n=1 Tax=Oceaniglobus ichthyenteri TaxID=2136177 RepID=UPI000D3A77DF|nr:DMT family transporter [Oceaniglobus ichthyenteri]
MTLTVFCAVLFAALLHASWNALVKGGVDKRLGMCAVTVGHLPLALIALLFVPLPAPESMPYLFGGMALHTGYQIFLVQSYKKGDLTQVYPIARGSAPLIVAAVSVFVLGVSLAPLELAGIVVIASGILSIALVRQADGMRNGGAAGMALITGCFIASYSLVDGMGARLAGTAVGFFAWIAIGNAAIFLAYMSVSAPRTLPGLFGAAKWVFWVGGSASFIAYGLVIWAFTQAPIALVTALRETSIVFALLIGVMFLNERLNLPKVLATMATLLGAALLRLSKA